MTQEESLQSGRTTPSAASQRGWLKRLWHQLGSPRWFYQIAGRWIPVLGVLALVLLGAGVFWGLLIAPQDYQQGNSFRIFYVHVPAAMVSQSLYMGMGAAGLVLFVWRMKLADTAIAAILPLGMALTALALFSGGVWGKPTWGTYWEWDARTVSTLVMLFLFMGIFALREAIDDPVLRGRASALVAMMGTINIPIIKYSVDWWLTLHQPATFKLTEAPSMPPEMYLPLLLSVLGIYCLFGALLISRLKLIILEREVKTQWVRQLVAGAER